MKNKLFNNERSFYVQPGKLSPQEQSYSQLSLPTIFIIFKCKISDLSPCSPSWAMFVHRYKSFTKNVVFPAQAKYSYSLPILAAENILELVKNCCVCLSIYITVSAGFFVLLASLEKAIISYG